MPNPLAPIRGIGDALLSVMINVEQASNLREAVARSNRVWAGIMDGYKEQLEWLQGFGVFRHSTVGAQPRHPSQSSVLGKKRIAAIRSGVPASSSGRPRRRGAEDSLYFQSWWWFETSRIFAADWRLSCGPSVSYFLSSVGKSNRMVTFDGYSPLPRFPGASVDFCRS